MTDAATRRKVKLCRPGHAEQGDFPRLGPALARAIRWDLTEQDCDQMIHVRQPLFGWVPPRPAAVLRRFTRNASYPVYQAMLEVGRALRTIFVCRYLRDRNLQREIEEGLNVGESWSRVNAVIFFGNSRRVRYQPARPAGRLGMLARRTSCRRRSSREHSDGPGGAGPTGVVGRARAEDKRGLTPLFWRHILPYGR